MSYSVASDGALHVERRQRGGAPWLGACHVAPGDLLGLLELLVGLEAWRSLPDDTWRRPVPDESFASLVLELGGDRTSARERFNDLGANNRIARVRAWFAEHTQDAAETAELRPFPRLLGVPPFPAP